MQEADRALLHSWGSMTLREKQSLFALLVSHLIQYAHANGYDVTFGEAWRSPEEAERLFQLGKGIRNSLHTIRLAIDLNLFKDGKYLHKSEDYAFLGLYWESLGDDKLDTVWGGAFDDGNHFSIEHGGRK